MIRSESPTANDVIVVTTMDLVSVGHAVAHEIEANFKTHHFSVIDGIPYFILVLGPVVCPSGVVT